jgi:hypothetical protein
MVIKTQKLNCKTNFKTPFDLMFWQCNLLYSKLKPYYPFQKKLQILNHDSTSKHYSTTYHFFDNAKVQNQIQNVFLVLKFEGINIYITNI